MGSRLRLAVGGLVLVCALAGHARALEDVWGNPIALTFEIAPDHLVLGDDARAKVIIKVSGAMPEGADKAPLKLWTSAGALSAPERKAAGWIVLSQQVLGSGYLKPARAPARQRH